MTLSALPVLYIACNDGHGQCSGRAKAIRIGSIELLDLSAPGPKLTRHASPSGIRLAGKFWHVSGWITLPGPMSCDGFVLRPLVPGQDGADVLAHFARWVRSRRLYVCTCAPTPFFEWFDDPQARVGHDTLRAWIAAALED